VQVCLVAAAAVVGSVDTEMIEDFVGSSGAVVAGMGVGRVDDEAFENFFDTCF
jgi:hypothetical protein